jgi:hypothetical protein
MEVLSVIGYRLSAKCRAHYHISQSFHHASPQRDAQDKQQQKYYG